MVEQTMSNRTLIAIPPPPPPIRKCGSCSLCCKLLAVEEGCVIKNTISGEEMQSIKFSKPEFEWCKHFKAGIGCTIYSTRPEPCRNYQCLWLKGQLIKAHSPRRTGVVITAREEEKSVLLTEDRRGLAKQHFGLAITEWSRRGLAIAISSPDRKSGKS
jgi:hypothetical protein